MHSNFFPSPPLPSHPIPSHPIPSQTPKYQQFRYFPTLKFPTLKFPTVKAFSSDEFPVDEIFLEAFGPKEKESEDEARRKNWVECGWAPWEEILSLKADFARKSLNEGEEVPLQNPETIEAFRMLVPKYRKKKMEETGLTEDEYLAKQFEMKGEKLEPLTTMWAGPLVVRHVPPRDWPPRGSRRRALKVDGQYCNFRI